VFWFGKASRAGCDAVDFAGMRIKYLIAIILDLLAIAAEAGRPKNVGNPSSGIFHDRFRDVTSCPAKENDILIVRKTKRDSSFAWNSEESVDLSLKVEATETPRLPVQESRTFEFNSEKSRKQRSRTIWKVDFDSGAARSKLIIESTKVRFLEMSGSKLRI
jgi:hypothetical protein